MDHRQRSQSSSTLFPSAVDSARLNSLAFDEIPESPAKRPSTEDGAFPSLFMDTIHHRLKRSQTLPTGSLFAESSSIATHSEQTKFVASSSKRKTASAKSTLDTDITLPTVAEGSSSTTSMKPSKTKARKRSDVESNSDSNTGRPPAKPSLVNGRRRGKLKKAKLTGSDEEEEDSGANAAVEEWASVGPLTARPPQQTVEGSVLGELFVGVDRPPHHHEAALDVIGSENAQENDDEDIEVQLPADMLRVLALSPSKHVKMETAERNVVENLFAGKRESKGLQSWDAGQVDQPITSEANDSEDDEWEGEGKSWWEADL